MYLFTGVLSYICGLIIFSLKRKHFLLMLLSLEFMIVSLFFNLLLFLSVMNYEYFFSMIFLTMSVCEGSLGLSVLILMIRTHGNDYMMTFSSLW
uniref:NADH-ubiquinone oxidoreductase chain 4L n=1 Tax=Hydrothassa fairmairei TaxID=1425571 RepID=A0A1P8NMU6_9CUCU|nr:NADH dehydrogenase subunit 4L [Hydrothassa fairmairei]